MLAKAKAALRKRKRDESVDVDMVNEGEKEGDGDWMDVDEIGDKGTPKKKRKSETGTVTVKSAKRVPASNRQLAGLRDTAVSRISFPFQVFLFLFLSTFLCFRTCSKLLKLTSYAIFPNAIATAWQRQARQIVQSDPKWYVSHNFHIFLSQIFFV